jgi:hypothetical protein
VQERVAGQCTHSCETELFPENRSWSNNPTGRFSAKALALGRRFATPLARISNALRILAIMRNYRGLGSQIPIRASAPMETGEYLENQPDGSLCLFDERFEVRQIVAVLLRGFAVTFMKAFKFNRLQIYGRDSVGG